MTRAAIVSLVGSLAVAASGCTGSSATSGASDAAMDLVKASDSGGASGRGSGGDVPAAMDATGAGTTDGTATGDAPTAADASAETGGDGTSATACFADRALGAPFGYVCVLPKPCSEVKYDSGEDAGATGGTPTPPKIDLEAAQCVLKALRDDTKGEYEVHEPLLLGGRGDTIWDQGDGSAVVYRRYQYDSPVYDYVPRRFPKKDDAFFDGCLASNDAKTIYGCLTSWWKADDASFQDVTLPCAATPGG